MSEPEPRCGFFAIIGAPNAGKSTLLNRVVGAKIAIVTPKVQTTRNRIIGIALHGAAQLVFIDTPGIFAPTRRLERAMVEAAWGGVADTDGIVLLIDAHAARNGVPDKDAQAIVAKLKQQNRRAVVILNKIDAVDRAMLLNLAAWIDAQGIADSVFMISALNGDGVNDLLDDLAAHAPQGPWHYPEDQLSEVPLRQLASEITREKLFLGLRQELPYALTVETETWEERNDGSVKIDQVIYVRRDSQKKIVLGKGGQQIKKVGAEARADLETILARRVHLFLFVKVRDNWVDDPERYRAMGLDFPKG
ncbi:MAG: GTPase Era [Proteobacteria bacterium]|nr:GTPase Era [Pseudomonadota bacterium]MDA1058937.1 GTPase Era [Pseudomonadota bacterium]